MPSGYTADVADGKITTLREFALRCARGMGALITMRDEDWDAPIPEELQPSTAYHDEALARARARLAELETLSPAECERRAEVEHQAAIESHQAGERERTETRNRYGAMIAQVVRWETEADGIKSFMLDQLHQSRDFDCGGLADAPPTRGDATQWREAALRKARRDIEYHAAEREKEIARTADRNRWLKALRDSLPPAGSAEGVAAQVEGEGSRETV